MKRAKIENRAVFVPYLTAGDPNLASTKKFVRALYEAGADILELGVPFSDPVADGPTIAKASDRALKAGTSLREVLSLAKSFREEGIEIPLVLFTYFNPLLKFGVDRFVASARDSQVDAVLVVDLPPEEAGEYVEKMKEADLGTIFLASPTTSLERLRLIDELSSEFVYYVSREGVTGESSELSQILAVRTKELTTLLKNPVCVGFGISNSTQAESVARIADGVVVGSALVRIVHESTTVDEAVSRIKDFVSSIVAKMTRREGPCSSS
jgi:tryptophan synthase alpha chain